MSFARHYARVPRRLAVTFAVTAAAAVALAAPSFATAAELLYAVDEQNRLVSFTSDTPRAIVRTTVTGLARGELIVGLDVRPANRQLYAFTTASRLYTINAATGAATPIGTTQFTPGISGQSFGFDFNPMVDRIRLTSDTRQNLRLHPDTGAVAAVDGPLTYAPAPEPGAAATPQVVASAYTNNVAGATSATLYNVDAARDALVVQNPPNAGTLTTVGALGVDIGRRAGFDIAADGTAFAVFERSGSASSTLYRVNLTTGAATAVGRVGGTPLRALAASGTAPADTTRPTVTLRLSAPSRISALVRRGIGVRLGCSEACTATIVVADQGRTLARASATTDFAREFAPFRLGFSSQARRGRTLRSRPTVTLAVRVTVRDAAGNTTTLRRSLAARR